MKSKISLGLPLLALILLVCLPMVGFAQSSSITAPMSIKTYVSIAPANTDQTYMLNGVYAIQNGLVSYGTPGTTGYYQQLGSSTTSPYSLVQSDDFHSWMGVADPNSAILGQNGNTLSFWYSIVSPVAFTPSSVSLKATTPFSSFSGTLDQVSPSMNPIEIYYGPDGIKGTADDVTYMWGSNTGNKPVNEMDGPGFNLSIDVSRDEGTTAMDAINNQVAGFMNHNASVPIDVQYYDSGFNAANDTPFSVVMTPEPSTLTIMGIGSLVGLYAKKRFKP